MRSFYAAAAAVALSLVACPALADNAQVELNTSWSGSQGTSIFLALTGRYVYVDGMMYSTRGEEECGCFDVPFIDGGGYNEQTGRDWFASSSGQYDSIEGYDISFGGVTETEFAVPSGGTLNLMMSFQSLQGDNSFAFTDPNGVRKTITSHDTINYSFTNTAGQVAFEWTSLSLNMVGTIPEPSEPMLMLAGGLVCALLRRRAARAQSWPAAEAQLSFQLHMPPN